MGVRVLVETPEAARRTLARVLRAYLADEIGAETARVATYCLNGVLGFFKHEADLERLQRLERVEQLLEDLQRSGQVAL